MMTMAGAAPWQLDLTKVEERCDYLLTSGLWADCTFVVDSETHPEVVYGHKLILAMASPVFEAMFYGALSEGHEIPIPDIQPDAFRALLAYIYTGETQICSFNLAWELWYAGKKYQLPHLVEECKKYIQSVIDAKNACRAYEMARFFEDKSLMNLCIQKMSTNAKEALNNNSFDDVELNTVITVCSLDPLNVDSELDLFHAVARYAKAQERTQEQRDIGVQVNFSEGGPTVSSPLENLALSKESQTPEEKKIRNNTKEALNDKSFEDVELNTVIAVFSLDPLNVDSELDLFHAVVRYAEAQERRPEQRHCPVGVGVSDSEGGPTVAPPSEKLSMSAESPTAEEKVVNDEIKSSAENTPAAVELDSKSDDTKEEVVMDKTYCQGKPNIRTAIQKIRFLSLTPEQFAEGPARSTLLSDAESFAIFMNINSKDGEVPMPAGFSNCRFRRQQVVSPAAATTVPAQTTAVRHR